MYATATVNVNDYTSTFTVGSSSFFNNGWNVVCSLVVVANKVKCNFINRILDEIHIKFVNEVANALNVLYIGDN